MKRLKGLLFLFGASLLGFLAKGLSNAWRGALKGRNIHNPLDQHISLSYLFRAALIIIVFICLALAGGKLLNISQRLRRRGKRAFAPLAESAMSKDTRPPLLLLRAFDDDEGFMLSTHAFKPPDGYHQAEADVSLEELVVMYLEEYGPVVAIGRPGEWAPPLGAARQYVAKDWHGEVGDLIRDCRFIVVILGRTDGLGWELRELIRQRVLHKVILVLPPVEAEELRRRWERFSEIAQEQSTRVPKEIPEKAVLASFGDDGECEIHESPVAKRGWFSDSRLTRDYATALKVILGRAAGEPNRSAEARYRITSVANMTSLMGVLSLLVGLLVLAMLGNGNRERGSVSRLTMLMFSVIYPLCLSSGAIALPGAIGARKHRQWGRVLCLINATLAIAIAAIALVSSFVGFLFFDREWVWGLVALVFYYASYGVWVFVVMRAPGVRRAFARQRTAGYGSC
jgi:hypothetical protein